MSELLSINGTNFISASDAGKICKYTSDYITKLARDGKIEATRMGRQWYVSPESLEAFERRSEKLKQVRSAEISKERKKELHVFAKAAPIKIEEVEFSSAFEPRRNAFVAAQQTVIILALGLFVGFGGYVSKEFPSLNQEASVVESSFESLERLALALYRFISPRESKHYAVVPVEETGNTDERNINNDKDQRSSRAIVVAPSESFTNEQVAEVRDSFSDEVEIIFDPENPDTGIIVPVFKERRGDEYRFLLMPFDPDQNSGT